MMKFDQIQKIQLNKLDLKTHSILLGKLEKINWLDMVCRWHWNEQNYVLQLRDWVSTFKIRIYKYNFNSRYKNFVVFDKRYMHKL